MKFLTRRQIEEIHRKTVRATGCEPGILNESNLEICLKKPQTIFYGYDPFPNLFEKASVYLQSIICLHPFVDGNKRTALTVTEMFLEENEWYLEDIVTNDVDFLMKIEAEEVTIKEIASWLKKSAHPMEYTR